jgi:hypothetical protein
LAGGSGVGEVGVTNRVLLVAALGLALGSCAGVWGPKGNDTGGIIPWSPENEQMALEIANRTCNFYWKHAVISSIRRVPGDYITYNCVWDEPSTRVARR